VGLNLDTRPNGVIRADRLNPAEVTKMLFVYYSYVLKSVEHDYFYKGHCKDLTVRLQQHNAGMTTSIRHYIP